MWEKCKKYEVNCPGVREGICCEFNKVQLFQLICLYCIRPIPEVMYVRYVSYIYKWHTSYIDYTDIIGRWFCFEIKRGI